MLWINLYCLRFTEYSATTELPLCTGIIHQSTPYSGVRVGWQEYLKKFTIERQFFWKSMHTNGLPNLYENTYYEKSAFQRILQQNKLNFNSIFSMNFLRTLYSLATRTDNRYSSKKPSIFFQWNNSLIQLQG